MTTNPNNTEREAIHMTSIRLSREEHRVLKELAAREHRTVSHQIRHLLAKQLQSLEEQEAA